MMVGCGRPCSDPTPKQRADAWVYEEGSLVKALDRDLSNTRTSRRSWLGDAAYHGSRRFHALLMPSHAKEREAIAISLPTRTRHGSRASLTPVSACQQLRRALHRL